MHRVLIVSAAEPSAILHGTVLWRTSLCRLVVANVETALASVSPQDRPLMVLDGFAPRDAEHALRQIRADSRGRDLCVAVVAPYATVEEEKGLRHAGATVVLCGEPDPLTWDFRLTRALHVPPRLDERVPACCRVVCRSSPDEEVTADAVNLGERGVLLKTLQPFGPGARVDLEVILPDGGARVPFGGQVVREEQVPDGAILVAMEFVVVPPASREMLLARLAEARRS